MLKEKLNITWRGKTNQLRVNFWSEAVEARRQQSNAFKMLKEKPSTPNFTCSKKISRKWRKNKDIPKGSYKSSGPHRAEHWAGHSRCHEGPNRALDQVSNKCTWGFLPSPYIPMESTQSGRNRLEAKPGTKLTQDTLSVLVHPFVMAACRWDGAWA